MHLTTGRLSATIIRPLLSRGSVTSLMEGLSARAECRSSPSWHRPNRQGSVSSSRRPLSAAALGGARLQVRVAFQLAEVERPCRPERRPLDLPSALQRFSPVDVDENVWCRHFFEFRNSGGRLGWVSFDVRGVGLKLWQELVSERTFPS